MFRIIQGDNILYETGLGLNSKELKISHHLIMYSALDSVEEQQYLTQNMYLKSVELTDELGIYAFVTASNVKFLILVNIKQNEEKIKQFFIEVYEIFVKNMMNPLYKVGSRITSSYFDLKVKVLISKQFQ